MTVWAEQKSVEVYAQSGERAGPAADPGATSSSGRTTTASTSTPCSARAGELVLSKVMIYEPPATVNGFPTLTTAKSATEREPRLDPAQRHDLRVRATQATRNSSGTSRR